MYRHRGLKKVTPTAKALQGVEGSWPDHVFFCDTHVQQQMSALTHPRQRHLWESEAAHRAPRAVMLDVMLPPPPPKGVPLYKCLQKVMQKVPITKTDSRDRPVLAIDEGHLRAAVEQAQSEVLEQTQHPPASSGEAVWLPSWWDPLPDRVARGYPALRLYNTLLSKTLRPNCNFFAFPEGLYAAPDHQRQFTCRVEVRWADIKYDDLKLKLSPFFIKMDPVPGGKPSSKSCCQPHRVFVKMHGQTLRNMRDYTACVQQGSISAADHMRLCGFLQEQADALGAYWGCEFCVSNVNTELPVLEFRVASSNNVSHNGSTTEETSA
jgi:hypothetical protein